MSQTRILFLGNLNSPYIKQTVKHLTAAELSVDVIDIHNERYQSGETTQEFKRILRFAEKLPVIKKIVKILRIRKNLKSFTPDPYDAVHIHFFDTGYARFYRDIVLRSGKKLAIFVWGSDFYRVNDRQKRIQQKLYRRADAIHFNNPSTRDRFLEYYGEIYQNKCRLLFFGLDSLDRIDHAGNGFKAKHGIAEDMPVISVGYNGIRAQNHVKVIEALYSVRAELPERIHFVLPMTYGADAEYVAEVESALRKWGTDYTLLRDYMTDQDIAELRRAGDVFIHMQTSDSFSASMQEVLYAGNIVVNAGWLDYSGAEERGVYFVTAADYSDMAQKVTDIFRDKESYRAKCADNPRIIRDMSGWEHNLPKWVKEYERIIGGNGNESS